MFTRSIKTIISNSFDNVIPLEVKSGNNRDQSLNTYNEIFKPNLMIKIGNFNFGKVII